MGNITLLKRCVALATGMALCTGLAWAQADPALWLSPKLTEFDLQTNVEATYYGRADVDERGPDVGLADYRFHLLAPVRRTESSEWLVSVGLEKLDVSGSPKLRRSETRVPGELYDLTTDPDEFENLWDSPAHVAVKVDMLKRACDAGTFTMDPGPERLGPW